MGNVILNCICKVLWRSLEGNCYINEQGVYYPFYCYFMVGPKAQLRLRCHHVGHSTTNEAWSTLHNFACRMALGFLCVGWAPCSVDSAIPALLGRTMFLLLPISQQKVCGDNPILSASFQVPSATWFLPRVYLILWLHSCPMELHRAPRSTRTVYVVWALDWSNYVPRLLVAE